MSKPYEISREDLLADRTSLVHVYLMFVVYRTKCLRYNLFYVCVCVCVCVCACAYVSAHVLYAVLQCIFISYYICRQQIILGIK